MYNCNQTLRMHNCNQTLRLYNCSQMLRLYNCSQIPRLNNCSQTLRQFNQLKFNLTLILRWLIYKKFSQVSLYLLNLIMITKIKLNKIFHLQRMKLFMLRTKTKLLKKALLLQLQLPNLNLALSLEHLLLLIQPSDQSFIQRQGVVDLKLPLVQIQKTPLMTKILIQKDQMNKQSKMSIQSCLLEKNLKQCWVTFQKNYRILSVLSPIRIGLQILKLVLTITKNGQLKEFKSARLISYKSCQK